jgi:RNA polymerase sigma factor (sigma-70 family)
MTEKNNRNYKEIDRDNFIELNSLQLEYINLLVKIPSVLAHLKKTTEELVGRYQYFQLFYNTRVEKNSASKDREAQSAALEALRIGTCDSVREVLIKNKLKLKIQKRLLPLVKAAKNSTNSDISEVAKMALSVARKTDRQRNKIIMSKHRFIIGESKNFFNVDPQEVEQIGMLEMIDIVERYNLDEKLSIFSTIKMRIRHVLRRTLFSESNDALNKKPVLLSLEMESGSPSAGDTLELQLTDGVDSAQEDHEFYEGIKRFQDLIDGFSKQKRYIAKKFFLEAGDSKVDEIAEDIGHQPQYVYKIVRSIEKEFREKLN